MQEGAPVGCQSSPHTGSNQDERKGSKSIRS